MMGGVVAVATSLCFNRVVSSIALSAIRPGRVCRSVCVLLVFCHLGLAAIWLVSVYASTANHHASPIAQHHHDGADRGGDDPAFCDHGCHALAHLIALPSTPLSLWSKQSSLAPPGLSRDTASLPADPPQKPPRSLS